MLWLALHNSLPTREVLNRRHIVEIATCPQCGGQSESISHCFRECPVVQDIWIRLGFQNVGVNAGDESFRAWIIRNIRGSHETLFLSILWWLWKWRNNVVFEPSPWRSDFVVRNILATHVDVISSAGDETNDEHLFSKIWWQAPPAGYVKLNLDGSFSPVVGVMGSGGVVRDSVGHWLWGFTGCHEQGSALLAELLAFKVGLTIAWEKDYRKIICVSDSLEAIHLLQNANNPYDLFVGNVLIEIKEILNRNWEVQLSHSLRDANMLADRLAKFRNEGIPGVSILDAPLLDWEDIIALDSVA
ncbi:Ribonuclease H domain [Sesbania bispinosa]|nr:Ribonuclease H domain [Sesbania bispinosa]